MPKLQNYYRRTDFLDPFQGETPFFTFSTGFPMLACFDRIIFWSSGFRLICLITSCFLLVNEVIEHNRFVSFLNCKYVHQTCVFIRNCWKTELGLNFTNFDSVTYDHCLFFLEILAVLAICCWLKVVAYKIYWVTFE